MTVTNLAIIGASGKMGTEISKIIDHTEGWSVKQSLGQKPGMCSEVSLLEAQLVDMVVDFSNIKIFEDVLGWCVSNNKPLVSGTTGLSAAHHQMVAEAGKVIPILWSPNMSVGIAWLTRTMKQLGALAQDDFDFQIEELHHRHKVDSPSGTAKSLQKELSAAVQSPLPEPISIRGGGIFGIHKIWAMSADEVITLEHQALNRTVFAKGAVRALLWLKGQSKGVYMLTDTL